MCFCDCFLWQLFILCQLFLIHCSHIPSYLTQRIPDEGGWIMIVTRNKEDMSYKKHDKTRFETNVQTLWVENTYDFYIDIIRWYFDLRRRNEWKILVMLLVSNFLFRTLIHLVEVKTSCEWFHSSTFLCCINVVNFLIQRSAVGNGKNHSFIYPNRNA